MRSSNYSKYLSSLGGTSKPVVFGYFGGANIGDDLMFRQVASHFKCVYVPSAQRIRSQDRGLPFPIYAIHLLLNKHLIFCGGNIFVQTSARSVAKIFAFCMLFLVRKLAKRDTILVSIGLEDLRGVRFKSLVLRALRLTDFLHIRSALAHDEVAVLGPNAVVGRDIVFDFAKNFSTEKTTDSCNTVVFFPSSNGRRGNRADYCSEFLSKLRDPGLSVVCICQSEGDVDIVRDLPVLVDCKVIRYHHDVFDETLSTILASSHVFTERYHGFVLAHSFGIPVHVENPSPKLRELARSTI